MGSYYLDLESRSLLYECATQAVGMCSQMQNVAQVIFLGILMDLNHHLFSRRLLACHFQTQHVLFCNDMLPNGVQKENSSSLQHSFGVNILRGQ
jgi:hypothetical protein